MEIAETSAPSKITINIDCIKPFEAHNVVEFTLNENGQSTEVTWAIRGPSSYLCRVIGLFINIDRMVSNNFETGLADLKTLAEAT